MRVETRDAEYAEFVTARQTDLRRLAYVVCGDWGLADDLLRSALTQVYVAWPRLRRDGTEEVCARRVIVRASAPGTGHRWWPAPRRRARPSALHQERAPVVEALQSLPAPQRKTVVLRHWLGLTVEETAEDLGISTRSVRTHEARALAALDHAQVREPP
jgi:DNA-directed RNA polymerase specialized sigma24 family protein